MKKVLSWQWTLLMLWPYMAMAANLLLIRIAMAAWLGGLLGTLLVTVISLRHALQQDSAAETARLGMLVKLLHIPAYVMSALMAPLIWTAPPLGLALLGTNACMLLATSAYTLRASYLGWRSGQLAAVRAAVLAISQLIFVLDVPGSILIYAIEKRRSL